MFVGHYGPAFAARALAPAIPLWVGFLAVQLVDVAWSVLVLAGIEKVRIVPGITATNPLDLYYMPWTHSLLAALAWSGLTVVALKALYPEGGWKAPGVLGAAVFSHWVLDFLVHRPDLPLYDNTLKVGLGLWNLPVVAFVLELAVFAGGFAWWVARARPSASLVRAIAVLGAFMVIVHVGAFFGAPPENGPQAAIMALVAYIAFTLAAWRLEAKYAPYAR